MGGSNWGLTQYAIRKRLEERGYSTSNMQFKAFREWGLIDEPEEGFWFDTVIDRIIDIKKAEPLARRFERRTILLGTRDTEKRRKAMIALIPLVRGPALKMRRLERALAARERLPRPRDVFGNPAYWRQALPDGWNPPLPGEWPAVLRSGTSERFQTISHSAYYQTEALLGQPETVTRELRKMPREELTLLLTIRELSIGQQSRTTNDLKG